MENISKKLEACGIKRTTALVVEYLSKDFDWHSSRDIERNAGLPDGLRQPEVSISTKTLAAFIEVRDAKGISTKGRPVKEFRMAEENYQKFIAAVSKETDEKIEKLTSAKAALVAE